MCAVQLQIFEAHNFTLIVLFQVFCRNSLCGSGKCYGYWYMLYLKEKIAVLNFRGSRIIHERRKNYSA